MLVAGTIWQGNCEPERFSVWTHQAVESFRENLPGANYRDSLRRAGERRGKTRFNRKMSYPSAIEPHSHRLFRISTWAGGRNANGSSIDRLHTAIFFGCRGRRVPSFQW